MTEKLKTIFGWTGAIIIALAVYGLCYYLGILTYRHFSNRPEIPDSSKSEAPVIIKDITETAKWKDRALSAEKKLSDYLARNERRKSNIKKIKHENEVSKQKAINSNDSVAYAIFDSLIRTSRYRKDSITTRN